MRLHDVMRCPVCREKIAELEADGGQDQLVEDMKTGRVIYPHGQMIPVPERLSGEER